MSLPSKRKPDAAAYLLASITEELFKTTQNYTVTHYSPGEHSALVIDSTGAYFTVTVARVDPTLVKG